MFHTTSIGTVLALLIQIYSLGLLVWVVASWIPQLRDQRALRLLGRVYEPLLRPVRRVLPATAGLDLSPMVVLLGLQLLARWLQRAPF